jgi:4'-phosphopantetheinyl transferase
LATAGSRPGVAVVEATDDVLARRPDARALLTDREAERADRFVFDRDRRDYVAAHVAVRECAAVTSGLAIGDIRLAYRCPDCGSGEHGRPLIDGVPGLFVSLSHARSVVAAAAAYVPVAVDVEPRGSSAVPADELLTAALTPPEIASVRAAADPGLLFLRYWVRKEALAKVAVLRMDQFNRVDVSGVAFGDGEMAQPWRAWRLLEPVDDSWVAAVAWRDR